MNTLVNTSSRLKKIKKFLKLKFRDKLLLLEALCLTAIARIIILTIPFKYIKKFIGKHKEETPFKIDKTDYIAAYRIGWAVNIVQKHTPWESLCLVQALTAQNMLKRRKLSSTLYLGVKIGNDKKNEAHAWLRCGEMFVTGGINKNEFAEVARFGLSVKK